jgi:hypothetical protein
MQRLCVLLVLGFGGDAFAESEHYEPIRVDAGMTGSSVGVSDRNAVGFVAEIKVNVHDNVAVGGRVEIATMFGGELGGEELPFGLAAAALAKAEYLLGRLGAGLYSIGSHTIVSDDTGGGISTTSGRYFGVAPEAGIDVGRLRFAITYNAILGTSVEYRMTTGGIEHRESLSQSYLSLELSIRIGGGRKSSATPD